MATAAEETAIRAKSDQARRDKAIRDHQNVQNEKAAAAKQKHVPRPSHLETANDKVIRLHRDDQNAKAAKAVARGKYHDNKTD